MRKWILIVMLLLLAIAVFPLAVGGALPEGHVATSAIVLRQPADSVWAVVRDLAGFERWWPDVERMELRREGGREIWVQHDRHGQPMPFEVLESTAPNRLVTRIVDAGLPFGGSWTYEIAGGAAGSTVTITERGEIYNPIFRVVARWFLGYHGTMDSYLTALGARFGEDVTPVHRD